MPIRVFRPEHYFVKTTKKENQYFFKIITCLISEINKKILLAIILMSVRIKN